MANLINENILQNCIDRFIFPEGEKRKRIDEIISSWQNSLENGRLYKETASETDFYKKFFCEILGYETKTDVENTWTIEIKPKTDVDSKESDAALGFFQDKNKRNIRCVVELKDASCNLDAKQQGRESKLTPVQQAFQYLTMNSDCDWVIVSNLKEIRLYYQKQTAFELFDISKLNLKNEFERFYYCLCRENLIDENKRSVMDNLLKNSNEHEKQISDAFYKDYKKLREKLFNHICENNNEYDKKYLLEKTQKLLDRLVFIMFCEDTKIQLLPNETIKNLYERTKNFSFSDFPCKIWEQFKDLFKAIDKGCSNPPINRYNGGMFAQDNDLDNLVIKDTIWEDVVALSEYKFESDLNVNVLGNIFEKSIKDLEKIRNEIDGVEFNAKKSQQKTDGVYYTPEYITRYIVEQTVGKYLEEHPDKLETIKILDPACGSGAFLNQAHSFLKQQYKINTYNQIETEKFKKGKKQLNIFKHSNLFEIDSSILLNNLFGVDLNQESVEITKLALWLKTARKDKPLQNLDANIKCGNSLIDEVNIAKNKAFKWRKEFKEIMDNGGFDIIIGNPPYVNISNIENDEERKFLQNKYKDSAIKRFDLYTLFIDLSLSLLKKDGYLSFIIPYPFLSQDYGELLRKKILEKYSIVKIVNLQHIKVFEDAEVKCIIIVIKNAQNNNICLLSETYNENDFNQYLEYSEFPTQNWLNTENVQYRLELFGKNKTIIDKMKKNNLCFGDLFYISKGASLHSEKFNRKGADYISEKYEINKKPFLQGKDCVSRYCITKTKGVNYKREEHYRPMFPELFENEKLVIYKVTGDKGLIVCYDNQNHYTNDSLYLAVPYKHLKNTSLPKRKPVSKNEVMLSTKIDIKFALSIINSKLINYYFKKVFGYNLNVYPDDIKRLPIPNICKEKQENLIHKANQMIELNTQLYSNINNSIELIKSEYHPTKISKDLEKFYKLDINEFFNELSKQKVKLSLNKKEELIKWYNEKIDSLNRIQNEINKIDDEINKEVYALYGLSPDEIKLVENQV